MIKVCCPASVLTLLLLISLDVSAQKPATGPVVTKAQVDSWITELSNWGRWGKDDQLGTLNLLTPDVRKRALALAKDGVSISLAHTLDRGAFPDNPRPVGQQMTLDAGGHAMDLYSIWYHGSTITHIDALCHYSYEGRLYNGMAKAQITPEICHLATAIWAFKIFANLFTTFCCRRYFIRLDIA